MDQRVVVQCITPEQRRQAEAALTDDVAVSGAVVTGRIAEEQIPRLREQGLLIDVVEAGPMAGLPGAPPPPATTTRSAGAGAAAAASGLELLAAAPVHPDDVWVLQLGGPLLPQWQDELATAGATVIEHQGGLRYTARLELAAVPGVDQLPFVAGLRPYGTPDTVNSDQLTTEAFVPGAAAPAEPATASPFELLVHRPEDLDRVLVWLKEHEADVQLHTDRKVRFAVPAAAPELARQVAALPEVATLYAYERPRPTNDHSRRLLGIDQAQSPVAPALAQTGRGQVVGIADTGLDDAHPDFQGRIAGLFARAIPGDTSDREGHGTHVAGSVLGDGAASAGAIRGAAPEAQVVFQALANADGELVGLDPSFTDVLQQAYDAGVRIHSDSWGVSNNASAYRADSLELDAFVAEHPDMLVLMAAGNSGTAVHPLNSARGFVDLMSVDAPGTAKNALTVGACRSDRAPVEGPAATFGAFWPSDFPDPPISDQPVSGDPESMAAFSSRGPCDEQLRLKPDVVAPGTYILSTRASTADARHFWAVDPSNSHYAYNGGTSMATPLVAGCAALVREYLVDERSHAPSAALLKAVLVNGARWLSGQDAVADHATDPNYHQGFGCVSLPDSLPNASRPGLAIEFSDVWDADGLALAQVGDGQRFTFTLAAGEPPLRACLAWTDPPGRSVQNSLTLVLQHADSGRTWIGNAGRPTLLRASTDMANNVQVVREEAPPAGSYVATVLAVNLSQGPQRFALVVGGALGSSLTSIGPLQP